MKKLMITLLIMQCSMNLFAQEEKISASDSIKHSSDIYSDKPPFFKAGSSRLSIFIGNNRADDEPQLVNMRNQYAFGFGISSDFTRLPNFGFDFDFLSVNRDYDTPIGPPLWGTIDKSTSVKTTSALVGIRAFIPQSGPFRAYASAGVGYFRTRMRVFGTVIGFPGKYEEEDASFNIYHGAGIQYDFGRWGLSLDYRHFNLRASFSGFNISNANLDGDVYLLGWHYIF